MVCLGCGGESLTSPTNPLETYDQDRLWVLISAGGIGPGGDGCAHYYRDPDHPRWKTINRGDLSKVCPESMVKIAAYLEHNGVAGVKAAHLQRPVFWDQMQAKYEAIQQCQEQLGGDWFNPPSDPANPKPKRTDFPNYEAYWGAEQEYFRRREERGGGGGRGERVIHTGWRSVVPRAKSGGRRA